MSATEITTHAADAKARLSWQFQGKTLLLAFLGALAGRHQQLEDLCWNLAAGRYLGDAAGVQLDKIGHQVGQDRLGGPYPNGEGDSIYRGKIKAKIKVNHSRGTTPDLHGIVRTLLGDNVLVVQLVDAYPAGFGLAVGVTVALTSAEEEALLAFVQAGRAAGVKLVGLAWYTDPVFSWEEDPDPLGAGFDDGTNLPTAGMWAQFFWP